MSRTKTFEQYGGINITVDHAADLSGYVTLRAVDPTDDAALGDHAVLGEVVMDALLAGPVGRYLAGLPDDIAASTTPRGPAAQAFDIATAGDPGDRLRVPVNERTQRDLEALLATGLFGTSIEAVAEGLLREKLRELALQGWIEQ